MSQPAAVVVRPRLPPALGIAVGVLAISTASILIRFAQSDGVPSLTIAAFRLTFASLVLLPIAWGRCRAELAALSVRDLLIGSLSGAFLGAHFATWITSLQYTGVASSVVLVTLSPLFVALASALLLKERLSHLATAGILLAVTGGILTGLGGGSSSIAGSPANPLLGNGLALAGALCIAPHFLIGRRLRIKLSLLAYISLVYSAAALILLAAVLATGTAVMGYDPQSYLWMALLALLPQLVGHTSFNWSLGFLPATFATIPVLAEPIGSTLLAVLLLREAVWPLQWVGGVLVISGIAVMTVSRTLGAKQTS